MKPPHLEPTGAGKAGRQRRIVQGRITDESLFANIHIAISERINSTINSVKKELKELQRQTLEGLEEDIDNAISYVSDGSMAAEDQKKVEELIEVVNGLKDEAEAVGRIAAQ